MRLKISMIVHIFAKFYRHVLLFVECLFNIDNARLIAKIIKTFFKGITLGILMLFFLFNNRN